MADDVWELYERCGTDRSDLDDVERLVLAICDLRQEVNAGGFDAYFRHWGGDTADVALAGIGAALGPEWEALLRDAMSVFGPIYPADDIERREAVLDRDGVADRLDALDRRFLDLETSVDADGRLGTLLRR